MVKAAVAGGYLSRIVLIADLAGTAVFAAEGAMAAAASGLDLLGVVVIAFVTALGGGMLRDVLLGATPPAALRDQRYPVAVFLAVAATMLVGVTRLGAAAGVLLVLDAAGLALFAVAGTLGALELGSRALTAAMLGTVTATGGGVIRDVLLAHVPTILRTDFYATAALLGAAVVIAARSAGRSPRTSALAGGGLCFVLRLAGAAFHWHLPTLH